MDWRHDALCAELANAGVIDHEMFFPVGTSGPAIMQITEAKAVCRDCPVLDSCREWALESGQDTGVWGGMSEDERRALKRRQAHVYERPEPYDTGYRQPPKAPGRSHKKQAAA